MNRNNNHLGSSLDDFLIEEGIYEECTEEAIKRVLAFQIMEAMQAQGLSKSVMADRMQTSRSSLNRLLDPESDSVTIKTLQKAAKAIGQKIEMKMVSA